MNNTRNEIGRINAHTKYPTYYTCNQRVSYREIFVIILIVEYANISLKKTNHKIFNIF